MSKQIAIYWCRLDLRLADNPALRAAIEAADAVIPLYIWSPEEDGEWAPGGAASWWLHQSLDSFDQSLRGCGSRLIIRQGGSLDVLQQVIEESGATSVYWNRRYEPSARKRDKKIKSVLAERISEVKSFNSALLAEPWQVENKQGKPYKVYTPFSKQYFNELDIEEPLPGVRKVSAPASWPESESLSSLKLEPKINWADGIRDAWEPGEAGAAKNLKRFLKQAVIEYDTARDIPGERGTSRLSPHLHFGEIGPRQIWQAVHKNAAKQMRSGSHTYLKEILWREFAYHLLFHFPHTTTKPLREEFARFPWKRSKKLLTAWQKGQTGYPIVDAGMRELWATGWMHNRVRMIVASFLVKHLLIRWQEGSEWFWDTLVDADLASNTLGWQWTAGCGADAAPYFRIFNPILQGEKFDPQGEYIRRWVPELSRMPNKWICKPWDAPADVLSSAGVTLDENYPSPIVDHSEARQAALEGYDSLKD